MSTVQMTSDRIAIVLSVTCAIHCLALPVLLAFLPSVAALPFGNEAFHLWLLFAVIPISLFALTMGCTKHKRHYVFAVGFSGIALLTIAGILGHDLMGETAEKLVTIIGSVLVAFSHFLNHRLCQQHNCTCESETVEPS